jgi:predicted RecB family nuclease
MEAGTRVGELACQLYPEGRRVDVGDDGLQGAVEATQTLMEDESVPAIFEATLTHNDLLMRADILNRSGGGRWDLIEVKSGTNLKEENFYDVWFQAHVCSELGIPLSDVGVMHLDSSYIRGDDGIDLQRLFTYQGLQTEVDGLDADLREGLVKLLSVVSKSEPPQVEMSKDCKGCEFFQHCAREKPEDWIFHLPYISEKKWNQLAEIGVERISEIPGDFKLSESQAIVRDCTVSGEEYRDDGLSAVLQAVEYPLYFLDFESFSEPIPRYVGMKPWQQVTFQWSCHVVTENGDMIHEQFLHTENTDPRPAFIESMLDCLGDSGTIVHYAPFEKTRIRELAKAFPQYAEKLKSVESRLCDLCQIIKSHYYHPDFIGSYSIKQVLPVLGRLSYENLAIKEGGTASAEYLRMIDPDTTAEDSGEIARSLLEYCKLDTLAMVRIWQELEKKAR